MLDPSNFIGTTLIGLVYDRGRGTNSYVVGCVDSGHTDFINKRRF